MSECEAAVLFMIFALLLLSGITFVFGYALGATTEDPSP